MEAKPLNTNVSVAAQITPEDVPEIAAAGYRAIICNRPDAEVSGEVGFDRVAAAARAAVLEARYMPVISGAVSAEDGAEFGAALGELPGPVLAYCRSGTRCAALWALSQAGQMTSQDILAATASAGYDLSGLVYQIIDAGIRQRNGTGPE